MANPARPRWSWSSCLHQNLLRLRVLPPPPRLRAPNQKLLRQQPVSNRPGRLRIMLENSPPELRRFGEPGVDAHLDREHQRPVLRAELVDLAAGELGAVVDHGEENAERLDARAGVPARALGGGDQVAQARGGE